MSAADRLTVIGLLSGTSVDGVDAALVRISGRGTACRARLERFDTFPFTKRQKERIAGAAGPGRRDSAELARLDTALGKIFARAALRIAGDEKAAGTVDLVGSHGQTMLHLPGGREGVSVQIGSATVIAQLTGIPVVSDFRSADVAAGGEGAPLLPVTDFLLFRSERKSRLIVNIGGMANLTFLPAGGSWEETRAYDTGPGNVLIDRIVTLQSAGRRRFDRGGASAARGRVDRPLLRRLLAHPFLRRKPPKSTGFEEFGDTLAADLVRRATRRRVGEADLLATVTAFTALSAGREIVRCAAGERGVELYVCGGGARNRTLVQILEEETGLVARPLDDLGIPSKAREAVGFALLASEFVRGSVFPMTHITGARRGAPLGVFTPSVRPFSISLSGRRGKGERS